MKKIRKRLLTLFLGTSCTIMASCSGDKSKTNKSNGALGNKDSETTPTRTTTGDLPGETPNNPQKGGLPNTPGTSGKSGGGTTGGNPNSGGKEQQPQPFVLSQDVKDAIEEIKKEFVKANTFKNFFSIDVFKQNTVNQLNSGTNLTGNKKISEEDITTAIDLGNGSTFCVIDKMGCSLVDYNAHGYMNAGNTWIGSGGGLADAFNKKFGSEMDTKIKEQHGILSMQYGDCKVVKIDWKEGDYVQGKYLFYAVGVSGFKDIERLIDTKSDTKGENLFYLTVSYLKSKYDTPKNDSILTKIKTDLGDECFDSFEKQINCNYKTIEEASKFAHDDNISPFYLSMNQISTVIFSGSNKSATKEVCAYINMGIMYYLASSKKCQNVRIMMWDFSNDDKGFYKNVIDILQKQK